MSKKNTGTPATHWLTKNKIEYSALSYPYVAKGGANDAAKKLSLDPHLTIKTLVMEDENKNPLIILMHGDQEVSTKNLARQTGKKAIRPCDANTAQRHSGYLVGGTSPFGLRKEIPICVEDSILKLERIYINGGKRGLLLALCPSIFTEYLNAVSVKVALD